MALIQSVLDKTPQVGEHSFLAENATLVGDVVLGEHCSVWFNAVIRGDVNYIRIGHFSNVQDGVVIHGTYQKNGTTIGNYVNIGHNALVHGCTVKDHTLIGMGAIVMDKAVVEEYVLIAAGAVVLEGTICETGYLYAGIPAKRIKPLTAEQRALLDQLPHNYVHYASWFQGEV
ncbi:gamma carbonic anhydrase family protein [Olivibacter ginsenosidimutans]|uniref:Gamma carbonic anhydrase family protein n=1 Tax=Olivibacter ginsenosidimutans TaxID=1176537 RepID=A0ABP9C495_9SPHI